MKKLAYLAGAAVVALYAIGWSTSRGIPGQAGAGASVQIQVGLATVRETLRRQFWPESPGDGASYGA